MGFKRQHMHAAEGSRHQPNKMGIAERRSS